MTKKHSETRNNIRAKRRKRLLRAILGLFKLALLLCVLAAVGWDRGWSFAGARRFTANITQNMRIIGNGGTRNACRWTRSSKRI